MRGLHGLTALPTLRDFIAVELEDDVFRMPRRAELLSSLGTSEHFSKFQRGETLMLGLSSGLNQSERILSNDP